MREYCLEGMTKQFDFNTISNLLEVIKYEYYFRQRKIPEERSFMFLSTFIIVNVDFWGLSVFSYNPIIHPMTKSHRMNSVLI